MSALLLQVDRLDLFYGDAQALDGVSLEIAAGEIVAIVGANGAGKSSLIRAIHGIEKPAHGSSPLRRRRHRRLAVATASARWASAMSPRAGRSFPISRCWRTWRWAPRRAARARSRSRRWSACSPCSRASSERRRQAAGTLSGGEQQMLAIGRCLMGQPRLIMFDEPSLGLAPTIVQEVFRIVRRLNEEGLTILLVEQNVMASLKIAHRGYVLENGRIELSGSGSELLNDDRVRQAYLGL